MILINNSHSYFIKALRYASLVGSRPGRDIPKPIIKMVQTASLHGTHALGLEFNSEARLSKRPGSLWNCLWGHALNLGSIARVGYHIPVPDFYLVLHGLQCRKDTIMDKSFNQVILISHHYFI